MHYLFNLIFFQPLYNALVWFTDILPGGTIGWSVILLTVVVRLLLFPLQYRMTHTQRKLKELEPTLKELKTKHADDQKAQAEAMMALYREHGINPFSGVLLLIIQIPLLLALYWVFRSGFNFKPELLYSFVPLPTTLSPLFLGFIDLTKRSIVLALLAGAAQYFQLQLALPPTPKNTPTVNDKPSLSSDLAKNMSRQMRFTFPIMITIIGFGLPAAISLYWVTSNLFGVLHELIVRKRAQALVTTN